MYHDKEDDLQQKYPAVQGQYPPVLPPWLRGVDEMGECFFSSAIVVDSRWTAHVEVIGVAGIAMCGDMRGGIGGTPPLRMLVLRGGR